MKKIKKKRKIYGYENLYNEWWTMRHNGEKKNYARWSWKESKKKKNTWIRKILTTNDEQLDIMENKKRDTGSGNFTTTVTHDG